MLTYWETLTAIQSNVPVNDSYAQLWGRKSRDDYTVTTYIGTLPAVLTGTKAGYLQRYKIYGNTEQTGIPTHENPIEPSECGERTENLFPLSWPIDAPPGFIYNGALDIDASMLSIKPSFYCSVALVDKTNVTVFNQTILANSSATVSIPNGLKSMRVYITQAVSNGKFMLVSGSTAPTQYIPYGCKLPLASGNTPVDIYIGDDTLSDVEYVDSGTGKIYRMVGGALTPVEPPAPFPQIPTTANSTTISWAGEGLAPSQVELEYEKKR